MLHSWSYSTSVMYLTSLQQQPRTQLICMHNPRLIKLHSSVFLNVRYPAPHLQLPWRPCLSSAARCSVPPRRAPRSRITTSATSNRQSNSDSPTDSMSHDNPLALAFLGDAIWSVSSSSLGPAALVQCCARCLQLPPPPMSPSFAMAWHGCFAAEP